MVDILTDLQRQAEQVCNQGIESCEEKDFEAAHKLFQKAYEMDPPNAKINSWLGYTTALVERKVQKGLDYCRKAIDSGVPDAMFYRNIGVVYMKQSNKRAAIGAFARGLQLDKDNRQILSEWKTLGFRRKPVLSFLDRSHVINIKLGKFTWWFTHRNQ